MSDTFDNAPPKSVNWLGYGGLLPFAGLVLLIAFDLDRRLFWNQALIAYGAVILSFVGALHWAFAMLLPTLSPEQRRNRYIWSTIPALIAWPALVLPTNFATLSLIGGFAAHYFQDRGLVASAPLPSWYLPLRLRLSTAACTALGIGAVFLQG